MSVYPSTVPVTERRAFQSIRRFVDGSSDATMLLDSSLRFVYANIEARMRFPKADFADGKRFDSFLVAQFPGMEIGEVRASLESVLKSGSDESITILLATNLKQTNLRATALDLAEELDERLVAVTFFEPDGDALIRRLEFVLDSSTDGIFIVNRQNHIVYFNQACEKLTGWKRGEAVIQTYECANVLRCHNEAGESMGSEALCPAKVFFHRASNPVPHEMLITPLGGRERWVETNYSPIKNPSGEVEFIVGIIRDIDERKRLESQLIQNKNLALLGTLVSGIAHEIKNPLGILMSSVEVVLNEERPEAHRREAASFMKDEVRRLDQRVKDFLAFAQPKPLLSEKIDLNGLLEKVTFSYSTARNPSFRIVSDLGRDIPHLVADPDLLHQVFLNLIINADQAMPSGGVLKISTKLVDEQIQIRFEDEGEGISDEVKPKIFDPFFTTKKKGTGLGLSIVHQVLTSHRGKINVLKNARGHGVTFEILLPATS